MAKKPLGIQRSPSLESTSSTSSTASLRGIFARPDDMPDATAMQYGNYLYNLAAVMIVCPIHNKIGLNKLPENEKSFWFPMTKVKSEGYMEALRGLLKEKLVLKNGARIGYVKADYIDVTRFQVPIYYDFVNRLIFMVYLDINTNHPNSQCCTSIETLSWLTLDQLNHAKTMWGPEPVLIFRDSSTQDKFLRSNFFESTVRMELRFMSKPNCKNPSPKEEFVKSAGYLEAECLKLYSDFLQHCYPSQYMNNHSFTKYAMKLGFDQDEADKLFRSFLIEKKIGFSLTFSEFLLGFAALEIATSHNGKNGEIRCGYIFRYYNASANGQMNINELKELIADACKRRKVTDPKAIEQEIASTLKTIEFKDFIDERKFVSLVGQMKIRGTSGLLRQDILRRIRNAKIYHQISIIYPDAMTGADAKVQKAKGTCPRCREKRYTLATHSVQMYQDGTIGDPQEIEQPEARKINSIKKQMSNEAFTENTKANKFFTLLRQFTDAEILPKGKKTKKSEWSNQQFRIKSYEEIVMLCSQAEAIFRNEPRVIKVNSPCFVIGDIHGNIRDLMLYENLLWKAGPNCTAASYLFLGDYVDRGDYSVEVIIYLLACKILAPEKYLLLRGNHEVRTIQLMFTFKTECEEKFGEKLGAQIWEIFNNVFDVMPICAIIDQAIYCAHGGIPTTTKIEELFKIPCPLRDPESQSSYAWEILWNDPVNPNEFNEALAEEKAKGQANRYPHGFISNSKRGTAYYFSDEAVRNFFQANQLTHILRGHEVIPPGFTIHIGGRVITIFSSSKYCGGLNESACAFVENEKIRIMRLDTST